MKCLQCGKPASEINQVLDGVTLRECADGHRTGELSASQIADIDSRIGARELGRKVRGSKKSRAQKPELVFDLPQKAVGL